jgi:hypothetical protein
MLFLSTFPSIAFTLAPDKPVNPFSSRQKSKCDHQYSGANQAAGENWLHQMIGVCPWSELSKPPDADPYDQ